MADANLAIGDVIEVRFEGLVNQSRWNNVTHFAVLTLPPDPEEIYENLRELAELLHDAYYAAFDAFLAQSWYHTLTRVKRIRPTPSVFSFHAETAAGMVTGGVDEPDDALVIRFYTSQSGRSRQGRLYLAGIPDASVEDGLFDATEAVLLKAQANDLFNTVRTTPNGMQVHGYVWSPTLSNDGDPATLGAYPITMVSVDRVIRRQKRRDIRGNIVV